MNLTFIGRKEDFSVESKFLSQTFLSVLSSKLVMGSVTRWLDYFFNIWPFTTMKVCYFGKMFAKVGLKFCQLRNKPSKDCQRVSKFYQSDEPSPNLVTLVMGFLSNPSHFASIHGSKSVLRFLFMFALMVYLTIDVLELRFETKARTNTLLHQGQRLWHSW